LLSIVEYFIKQLEDNGFKNAEETTEFRNRHERVWKQLEKSVDEMRELESTLNRQMIEYPVLLLIPNLMRSLILIKLGVLSAKFAPSILRTINENTKKYNQAKRMVAFDFSRLPAAQYQLLRRQELILVLQGDILQFTGAVLEKKFAVFLKEYERIMLEIQTNSAQLDRNSREFKDLLKKKTMLQGEFEKRRRQLDVITSQKSLVEVQQEMMEQSLKTFDEEGSMHGRITEALKMTSKIEKPTKESPPEEKPEKHRMAAAERRSQE
jgi:myosin heavy subunit